MRRLFAVCTIAVIACIAATGSADTSAVLSLRTGQSIIVRADGLSRVAIGDGKIAGVVPVGTSEIVVNGKASGRTTLLVWAGGGLHRYDVVVIEQTLDNLRQTLANSINEPRVRVTSLDNALIIDGSVATAEQMVRISDIIARFAPLTAANKYTVVNAVSVARPLGPLQSELAADLTTIGVRVDPDLAGDLIVSGPVPDRMTAERVLARVRALAGVYLSTTGKVIDRLEPATVTEIDIKVYILEVDDTALRDLGVNLQSASFQPDGTYILGGPAFPIVESARAVGRAFTIGGFFRTITLAPTLNLVLNSGHSKLLSSPDLLTLPGHEANFLVGGQIPIPVSQGLGQTSVVFKDYGVSLKVTPALLGDGGVETVIAPEVSDLDFADGISLNGFVVPALKTSRLSTDVITKTGESIVLGGLMRRIEQRTIDKIPILGDLPILGKLFRSTRYQSQQSDVVFVMTPTVLTR